MHGYSNKLKSQYKNLKSPVSSEADSLINEAIEALFSAEEIIYKQDKQLKTKICEFGHIREQVQALLNYLVAHQHTEKA